MPPGCSATYPTECCCHAFVVLSYLVGFGNRPHTYVYLIHIFQTFLMLWWSHVTVVYLVGVSKLKHVAWNKSKTFMYEHSIWYQGKGDSNQSRRGFWIWQFRWWWWRLSTRCTQCSCHPSMQAFEHLGLGSKTGKATFHTLFCYTGNSLLNPPLLPPVMLPAIVSGVGPTPQPPPFGD